MVNPPICVAAIPVEAVTAGSTSCSRKYAAYSLITCVLPDPGSPVKKTFAPVLRIDNASDCFIVLIVEDYDGPPESEDAHLRFQVEIVRVLY